MGCRSPPTQDISALCTATHFRMGGLGGHLEGDLLDFFYFSMATYTTLGIGDLHPSGVMRVVAGVESLNGLVLLAATSAGAQGSACAGPSC